MVKRRQYVVFGFWETPTASNKNTYPKVKLRAVETSLKWGELAPDERLILKRLIAAISVGVFFLALLAFLHRGGRPGDLTPHQVAPAIRQT